MNAAFHASSPALSETGPIAESPSASSAFNESKGEAPSDDEGNDVGDDKGVDASAAIGCKGRAPFADK